MRISLLWYHMSEWWWLKCYVVRSLSRMISSSILVPQNSHCDYCFTALMLQLWYCDDCFTHCTDNWALTMWWWFHCTDITALILERWFHCTDITALILDRWFRTLIAELWQCDDDGFSALISHLWWRFHRADFMNLVQMMGSCSALALIRQWWVPWFHVTALTRICWFLMSSISKSQKHISHF